MTVEPTDGKKPNRSELIDWYSEGEERTVEVDGVQVTVRFVGRRGRRGRISVVAPAGAVFRGGSGTSGASLTQEDVLQNRNTGHEPILPSRQ